MEKKNKFTSFFKNNVKELGSLDNGNILKDLYNKLDLLEKRVKILETHHQKMMKGLKHE